MSDALRFPLARANAPTGIRLPRTGPSPTVGPMAALIDPTERLTESFARAVEEFIAEGRGGPDDHSLLGAMIRDNPGDPREWTAAYLELERRWRKVAPEDFVTMTMLWWTEGDTYLGRISIRHHLNEHLREIGGHIGYDIRPSARRRGHATAMLAAVLPHAAALGIEKALITCDDDNIASRKVIEANNGVFEDQRGMKLRYRVPTAPGGGPRRD